MRILLDENFPVLLCLRLRELGLDADHVILLGRRGVPDVVITEWLRAAPILFLTHDVGFLDLRPARVGSVLISRVSQSLPLKRRVETWLVAVLHLVALQDRAPIYELFDDGALVPWTIPRKS